MFTFLRRALPLFVLSFMILSSFFAATSAFASDTDSQVIDMTQKLVSLVFKDVPDDTVQTAADFVKGLHSTPERQSEFFGQVGKFFIQVGQGVSARDAAVELVRSQPELEKWYSQYGEPELALIIIIIIIIILLLCCTPAY